MVICSKNRRRRLQQGQRAVDEELKNQRRDTILAAALALLQRHRYEDLTIAAVARESGIAKGTVYLYYDTKEALFLALLAREFASLFEALQNYLQSAWPRATAAQAEAALIDWLLAALHDRKRFLRLLAMTQNVLEQNIDVATALSFKRELMQHAQVCAGQLESGLGLAPGAGLRLLLWLQALSIGLHHVCEPAPVARQALRSDPALAGFIADFATELRLLLGAALQGLRHSN